MIIVHGIAVKPEKGGSMRVVDSARVTLESGLENDCRGKGGPFRKLQVTLHSLEQWEAACRILAVRLPWYARRANVCVSGVEFGHQHFGAKIAIDGVILEVTGELAPCPRMDNEFHGLQSALKPYWRGGITCRVVQGGTIHADDMVVLS